MKITIVASSIFPRNSLGVEYFAYGMINSLVSNYPEYHFDILVPTNSLKEWQDRISTGKKIKFHEVFLSPGFFFENKTNLKGKIPSLRTLLKRNQIAKKIYYYLQEIEETNLLRKLAPDVVYYPFHRHPIRKVKSSIVMTIHDLRSFTPEFFDEQNITVITKNINSADALVCAWRHPYAHVSQLFPEHVQKLNLIPFPPPIMSSLQSKQIPVEQDDVLLLYPSWVTLHKNHKMLLEAMPDVIASERDSRKRNVKLVCVGSYEKETLDLLNQTVQSLSLRKNVEFTGFVTENVLRDYYSRATMVVCPTLWEAAAGTIFESFTYGKPVACSNIPPLVSQIEQANAHASFFNPLDPVDISRGILAVLENPEPYIYGSQRGAQYIRSLSWEKTTQQYMAIFEKLQLSAS